MKAALQILFDSRSLSRDEARETMTRMLKGEQAPEQVAAFLGALRAKGETLDEIVGFAEAIRARSVKLPSVPSGAIDTCGTGGDQASTFNISTAAAFVLASGGIPVAKHGNRSVSSRCGSADVIEQLGVAIEQSPEQASRSLNEVQFGFLFAPHFHPVLKAVGAIRRAIGVKTVFNLLGPMLNPAHVQRQVMGLFSPDLCQIAAESLRDLGCVEAIVCSSLSGLDELSIFEPNIVYHLKNGTITSYQVDPQEFGMRYTDKSALRGGDAKENAALIEGILQGEIKGAQQDVVALNAAAGFVVAGAVSGLKEGYFLARTLLNSGRPYEALQKVRRFE